MSEKFSARECALIAAKAADEHKATDIMVLEVGQLVDVTEYFVIATARNTPHVGAILEAMEDALRIECGVKPFSREETKDHNHAVDPSVAQRYQRRTRRYARSHHPFAARGGADLRHGCGYR